MPKDIICGLDIGTFKICATCGRLEPSGKIDILATQTVPAEGIEVGRIIDSKKVSACIKDAIEKLRKICAIKVHRVYANIDSPDLKTKVCEENLSFSENTRIKKSHIENLINSAIFSNSALNKKVIHTGFRNFIIDDRTNCIYPEDHSAHKLKLNIVIVSTLIPTIKSFIKCIRDAGLILEDIVPSGCAQALGLFRDSPADSERDNILIDVGGGLTKITLLKNRLVKDMAILPQGAQSITEDIASKLKLSFKCAEQLKREHGRLYSESKNSAQKIIVKDENTSKVVQAYSLYEIIALKADYLLHQIKKVLAKLNYDEKSSEIVVTGGGSILEGFLERTEEILQQPVKMGVLSFLKDNRIQTQSAIYATSIGLIHFGFRNRKSIFTRAKFNSFMPIIKRVEELYHEYF